VSSLSDKGRCDRLDAVSAYVLRALPAAETRAMEEHLASCESCQLELANLRPIVDTFVAWPASLLRPSTSLWDRLLDRIGAETSSGPSPAGGQQWSEAEWEDVAPGISNRVLSSDTERDRVTMLVRLAPGTYYPPHTHAGVEELHLLQGELWIEARRLYHGDYYRADPGTSDDRVWSETGCTCLLITSPSDVLR
jgi:quercetin dioxygenase-like cupin family protein